MTSAAVVLAPLAGALHVAIFVAESLWWRRPLVWRSLAIKDQAAADEGAFFAFNQGVYKLILAVAALLGAVLVATGDATIGWTLLVFGCASMVVAAGYSSWGVGAWLSVQSRPDQWRRPSDSIAASRV